MATRRHKWRKKSGLVFNLEPPYLVEILVLRGFAPSPRPSPPVGARGKVSPLRSNDTGLGKCCALEIRIWLIFSTKQEGFWGLGK